MNNYERYFSSVADVAEFIREHTTCFICPAHSGIETCDDCEAEITAWLLEDDEE